MEPEDAARTALIEEVEMVELITALAGPVAVTVGEAAVIVSCCVALGYVPDAVMVGVPTLLSP